MQESNRRSATSRGVGAGIRVQVLLCLATVALTMGCLGSPWDGDTVEDLEDLTVSGYVSSPEQAVDVQQFNFVNGRWGHVGRTVSIRSPFTDQAGKNWYSFEASVTLRRSREFWRTEGSDAAVLITRLRAVPEGGHPLVTFAPGAANCIQSNMYSGIQVALSCGQGFEVELRLHGGYESLEVMERSILTNRTSPYDPRERFPAGGAREPYEIINRDRHAPIAEGSHSILSDPRNRYAVRIRLRSFARTWLDGYDGGHRDHFCAAADGGDYQDPDTGQSCWCRPDYPSYPSDAGYDPSRGPACEDRGTQEFDGVRLNEDTPILERGLAASSVHSDKILGPYRKPGCGESGERCEFPAEDGEWEWEEDEYGVWTYRITDIVSMEWRDLGFDGESAHQDPVYTLRWYEGDGGANPDDRYDLPGFSFGAMIDACLQHGPEGRFRRLSRDNQLFLCEDTGCDDGLFEVRYDVECRWECTSGPCTSRAFSEVDWSIPLHEML